MSVLLLKLAGPLQSWGAASRFVRRETNQEPTKSGVLGLLAAAQGRRRTDPIEDLAELTFGVRVDQPGRLLRDFQTAHRPDGTSLPLSYRFYLSDAVFLAGVQGNRNLLTGLDEAVRSPAFPLYLGRRSCPPAGPISLGILDGTLVDVLAGHEWQASTWWRRQQARTLELTVARDAANTEEVGDLVRDHPLSYSPERREYGWRTVVRTSVPMKNPAGRSTDSLDFMAALGGA